MAPVTTTGFSVFTTKWRKKAVSSMVSVPWVITKPSMSSRRERVLIKPARRSQREEVISSEFMFETWISSISAISPRPEMD